MLCCVVFNTGETRHFSALRRLLLNTVSCLLSSDITDFTVYSISFNTIQCMPNQCTITNIPVEWITVHRKGVDNGEPRGLALLAKTN